MDGWTEDFERINRHRAYAEFVIHNRNWLPWWLVTAIAGDFCDQGERYLRGEGLPPLPVRLWWAYKHWRFKKGVYRTSRRYLQEHHENAPINPMVRSNISGHFYKPIATIPLAEGQRVEFIPVDNGQQIEVTDIQTGERKAIHVSNRMLRSMDRPFDEHNLAVYVPGLAQVGILNTPEGEFQVDVTKVRSAVHDSVTTFNALPVARSAPIPKGIGDYPRPNCPKCYTPRPDLGTPLDPRSESGWGDSFFTCSNRDCRHKWKWKKSFPLLEENSNREGTKTGAKVKGTDIPFHLVSKVGLTIEQVNEGVRKFANVAGLANMTPEQRFKLAQIIQEGKPVNACNSSATPLVPVTNHETTSMKGTRVEKTYHKNLRDGITYVEYKRMHRHR